MAAFLFPGRVPPLPIFNAGWCPLFVRYMDAKRRVVALTEAPQWLQDNAEVRNRASKSKLVVTSTAARLIHYSETDNDDPSTHNHLLIRNAIEEFTLL